MKTRLILSGWVGIAFQGLAMAEARPTCEAVARQVRASVSAAPDQVLKSLRDATEGSPGCACEAVKAAIKATDADAELVGQIVYTAVIAAPAEATTVAECAVAAAPEASATIKAALRRALSGGEKNPIVAGKNPIQNSKAPKNPKSPKNMVIEEPAQVEDDPDFALSPVSIGGVYLVYPGGGGSTPKLKPCYCNGKLVWMVPKTRCTTKVNPRPPKPPHPQRPNPVTSPG